VGKVSEYFKIYDKDYYDRYIERAKSTLGQAIYKARWELIGKHLQKGIVLDYGCGPNISNESAPKTFETYGYDINPSSGLTKIPDKKWDAILFWDSLEHIPDFGGEIKKLDPEYLFITTPNLEAVNGSIKEWKHYRPGEHIYYFDQYSLEVILDNFGYEILEKNFEEGKLRDPKKPNHIIGIVARKKSGSVS